MSQIKDKIFEIDTANFEYTGEFWASGWYIVTSANSAEVTITDANNIQVIRGVSALASERMIPGPPLSKPVRIKNLKVQVWTNIERVIIFIDRFGED